MRPERLASSRSCSLWLLDHMRIIGKASFFLYHKANSSSTLVIECLKRFTGSVTEFLRMNLRRSHPNLLPHNPLRRILYPHPIHINPRNITILLTPALLQIILHSRTLNPNLPFSLPWALLTRTPTLLLPATTRKIRNLVSHKVQHNRDLNLVRV